MSEVLPKKHSSSEELGLRFQNRGLFSDHFLKARCLNGKSVKPMKSLSLSARRFCLYMSQKSRYLYRMQPESRSLVYLSLSQDGLRVFSTFR